MSLLSGNGFAEEDDMSVRLSGQRCLCPQHVSKQLARVRRHLQRVSGRVPTPQQVAIAHSTNPSLRLQPEQRYLRHDIPGHLRGHVRPIYVHIDIPGQSRCASVESAKPFGRLLYHHNGSALHDLTYRRLCLQVLHLAQKIVYLDLVNLHEDVYVSFVVHNCCKYVL